ncbi:hypothetical protein D3C76_1301300 [compost metagenome]
MQQTLACLITALERKARAEIRVRVKQRIGRIRRSLIAVVPARNMALDQPQLRAQCGVAEQSCAYDQEVKGVLTFRRGDHGLIACRFHP